MTTLLSTRGVTKDFGSGRSQATVLHGVDLDIGDGEFVAIMGPSGSGKSTLLYCISGMDAVTSGTVHLDGCEITAFTQKDLGALRLARMGFVFQQVHLLRNLTLLDNVVLPGVSAGRPREEVVARARELLERMGIGELADRQITEASGGQLQRAAIARALVNEPQIVFGDEPTGALNAAAAAEIMDLLAEVNASGRTVVLVTHDAHVAARAGRVVVLRDGRIDGDLRRTAGISGSEWQAELGAWLARRGV